VNEKILPKEIEQTIEKFKLLPGVGEKSAMRNILHLLKLGVDEVIEFSNVLKELANINQCDSCGIYSEVKECAVCQSESRKNSKVLCVVENFNDFLAIEKGGEFNGLYHCLGGVLNPLLGVGPEDLAISKLTNRVKELNIENIILAINPTLEGQATCSYLREVLGDSCVVERIGFGMPMGGSLEYLDSKTISTAMQNKTRMS